MTKLLIVLGLATGAGLGTVGQFLPPGRGQDAAWFVSSIGFILGCALLAAKHLQEGRDLAAVGFLFLVGGELVMQAGQGADLAGRYAVFARGVGLYVPGLLLLALSDRYPLWVRIASAAAAVPFGLHALLHFLGRNVTEASPTAGIGYGLLTIGFIGWAVSLYRGDVQAPRGRTERRAA